MENMKEAKLKDENLKEDIQEKKDEKVKETGQLTLDKNKNNYKIHLLSIIGEIEGHECLPATTKTTKYEHVLPTLASIEDSDDVDGVLIIINTVGGDVESGLAIAEMIASLSKPTVSLVLGGSHSIGVPLAVATNYSFIVPTGTMIIHPVRINGLVIGVPQTFDYFKIIQDRILRFIVHHCNTTEKRLEKLMMETGILTKDVGTILVGKEAVFEGIIDEVGGIQDALKKLYGMIDKYKNEVPFS
ncbi:MAG: ClpP family protease [Lachnotalea sp.]